MLTSAQASKLLPFWSIGDIISVEAFHTEEYHSSGNIVFVQTQNGRYVLKRRNIEEWAEWRSPMLAILHAHGVPVAVPLSTCTGEPYLRHGDAVFTLSPYLPGVAMSDHFAGQADERAKQYGISLAKLHLALRECESIATPTEMNLLQDLEWATCMIIEAGFGDQTQNMLAIVADVTKSLEATLKSVPIQLIHRDAHAANLLYLDDKVTGWLDFDLAVRGPRLFDLCYCATSLLMNGLDDPNKKMRWTRLLQSAVNGYNSVSPLTITERTALSSMLLSIEALFAGYYASQHDRLQMDRNIHALLWIYDNKDQIEHIGCCCIS